MHCNKVLHKTFADTSHFIDKRLHKTLLLASSTLSVNRVLSISSLGRHLLSFAKVKHNIKRIDRLFGNDRLHQQRIHYYRTMARYLVGKQQHPIILVDWSGLTQNNTLCFLRASIPVGGRALTLWESAHPQKKYASQQVHQDFLVNLHSVLPDNCKPIIITDAGFHNSWFLSVLNFGWNFIGRVSRNTYYRQDNSSIWAPVHTLHQQATRTPKHVLSGKLSKTQPMQCHGYLYQGDKQYRRAKTLSGKKKKSSFSLKHAKRESQPLFVVSSLSVDDCPQRKLLNYIKSECK